MTGRRLPGRRQVNEDWLVAYRSWVYGAGFGLQLGAAVATVVNTALVPLFMLAALLAGNMTAGLVIGAASERPGARAWLWAAGCARPTTCDDCTAASTSTPTGPAASARARRLRLVARRQRACWFCDPLVVQLGRGAFRDVGGVT